MEKRVHKDNIVLYHSIFCHTQPTFKIYFNRNSLIYFILKYTYDVKYILLYAKLDIAKIMKIEFYINCNSKNGRK